MKVRFERFMTITEATDFATLHQENLVSIMHDQKSFIVIYKDWH